MQEPVEGEYAIRVEVFPMSDEGRQIGWDESAICERLEGRADDIRNAIVAGTKSVGDGLRDMAAPDGWQIGDVCVRFGIALTAEAGAIITKASVGATLEVAVTFVAALPTGVKGSDS